MSMQPFTTPKEPTVNFTSSGGADYESINAMLCLKPFKQICCSKIKNMYYALYGYLDQIIEMNVRRRTRHRQSLPSWITPYTSNLNNKLKIQQTMFKSKPTSYRKNRVMKLEKLVLKSSQMDRTENQVSLLETGNTNAIFKHLKA